MPREVFYWDQYANIVFFLLAEYQFSAEAPNVVHMSVKPAEMLEEDEAAKGKSSGREGRNREGGSGCCVIL